MVNIMKAKFQVSSTTRFTGFSGVKVELYPVVNTSDENKEFWKATPDGKLEMTITNPNAVDFFEVDKEYYLEFSEV
ncbi:hypothetical protein [Nostoc sp. TCL26-01]|uniref:hypothetical protein n=1 Tax=Nostoc sp. TCL26-01 TaxID=2576904 RepID=UPI0015B7C47B|nr:hypothetical protein [Nostoc sp. TCL26-01]QLE54840.1 hypothetical protein FD725_04505 [Nostoc sp. TCL26-01]